LFCIYDEEGVDDDESDGMGLLRAQDVRRCLMYAWPSFVPLYTLPSTLLVTQLTKLPFIRALNLAPTNPPELRQILETLDPEGTGFATYAHFVAVCALKLHHRPDPSGVQDAEIDTAFALFLRGGRDGAGKGKARLGNKEERISLEGLRRIAKELRIEVDEQILRDMVLEANGGAGVGRGVGREEFEGVMRRAGAF
jgi:Ca2+-binding EF-hand superfamily protein